MAAQPTNSGIVTDESGERHIPESVRADGSVRKAIKIRPGYRPAEDVQVYKNRTAETFRNRYKGGVIGAETADDDKSAAAASTTTTTNGTSSSSSAAANKNAKRREARKKAKAAETTTTGGGENKEKEGCDSDGGAAQKDSEGAAAPVDTDAERKKKARNLTKKLKQAKELKSKKDDGQSLLPEQFAKVIKINELVRELAALGFDSEGEPVKEDDQGKAGKEAKENLAPA